MGGHHSHEIDFEKADARLFWSIFVNVLLSVVQVIGGVVSGSLSLVADAIHNLSDAGALVIALIAQKVARRPADKKRTYGYRRAEIIGALINLTTLIIVGVYLLFEAGMRVFEMKPIDGWLVVWVAGAALLVDIITAILTYSMSKHSLNIRAAFLHNLSDAMASVGVIIAGTVIILYEWYMIDLIVTVLISAYVLYHGFTAIRQAIHILMEGVPADIDVGGLTHKLTAVNRVKDVHHIHLWQLDERHRAIEAHFVVDAKDIHEAENIKKSIRSVLKESGIGHATLELEFGNNSCEGPCF